jgi:hypothetical protein
MLIVAISISSRLSFITFKRFINGWQVLTPTNAWFITYKLF